MLSHQCQFLFRFSDQKLALLTIKTKKEVGSHSSPSFHSTGGNWGLERENHLPDDVTEQTTWQRRAYTLAPSFLSVCSLLFIGFPLSSWIAFNLHVSWQDCFPFFLLLLVLLKPMLTWEMAMWSPRLSPRFVSHSLTERWARPWRPAKAGCLQLVAASFIHIKCDQQPKGLSFPGDQSWVRV